MQGKDLKGWCMEMGGMKGCSECPAHKQCEKWKADLKKLADMEPWQLDDFKKLADRMVEGYDFKFGREI